MRIDYWADTSVKLTCIILYIWATYTFKDSLKKIKENKEGNNDMLLLRYLYYKEIRGLIIYLVIGSLLVAVSIKVKAILLEGHFMWAYTPEILTFIILYIWATYNFKDFSKKIKKDKEGNNDMLLLKYSYYEQGRNLIILLSLGISLVALYTRVKTMVP